MAAAPLRMPAPHLLTHCPTSASHTGLQLPAIPAYSCPPAPHHSTTPRLRHCAFQIILRSIRSYCVQSPLSPILHSSRTVRSNSAPNPPYRTDLDRHGLARPNPASGCGAMRSSCKAADVRVVAEPCSIMAAMGTANCSCAMLDGEAALLSARPLFSGVHRPWILKSF